MHFQCTDHTPESNVQKMHLSSQVSVSHHVQSIFIMSLFIHFVNYLSLFILSLLPPAVQAALLLFPEHIFSDTESFYCGFPVFVVTDRRDQLLFGIGDCQCHACLFKKLHILCFTARNRTDVNQRNPCGGSFRA